MSDFTGKYAVVTGAGKGIGASIVKRLLDDNIAGVALFDYDLELVKKTAAELDPAGKRVMAVKCDVSKADQVTEAVKAVQDSFGTIDILVNNAGITRDKISGFPIQPIAFIARISLSSIIAAACSTVITFPIEIPQKKGAPLVFNRDECVRSDASMESMAKLKPVLLTDGVVTAANSSPMNDGASAVILMSKERALELGLEPLAKVTGFASAGVDPNIMGIGPVAATRKLMKKMSLTIDDFDIIELNEAFAAQSLACVRELNIDMSRLNPNGGAIAIGHPNAASGGILLCRTVRHMKQQNLKRGLISFCCGGGQGFSLVVERD